MGNCLFLHDRRMKLELNRSKGVAILLPNFPPRWVPMGPQVLDINQTDPRLAVMAIVDKVHLRLDKFN